MKFSGMRIRKRSKISKGEAVIVRLIAIVLALIVSGFIIVAITKLNPLQVYAGIIDGAIGTSRRVWVTIRDIIILLVVSVGLVPAFKMKFWNIGAEGQMLMGGLAASALMIYVGNSIPNGLLLLLIVIASCVAGMLWGIIPAFFKAKYNTNETLFTLMMNYVAMQFTTFCIVFWEKPKGSNTVGIINAASGAGWFPPFLGQKYGLNLLFGILVTVILALYLKHTKHGYELSVVGESPDTARYAGINVKRVIVRTVALSGAICGFAGSLIVSGGSHTISTSLTGGRGFTAIIVAWLAHFNSFIMAAVSALLVFMEKGAVQIASQFGLNHNVSSIITGIILFFLIGSEFFNNYEVVFDNSEAEEK
ncbi:MAG: ABC transporter permease [Spirochaetales bacterium]|nr:ABC transporter permease [Spirochaetales bacterium]